MLSTAVSIEFEVYDLTAFYKVVGSSQNYSFEEDLGLGSDLVEVEGAVASKVVSLKGNYGKFSIRVFAESSLGIRSNFIEEDVIVSPPSFDGTFTFSNLRVSNLPEDSNQGYYINTKPTKELNELIVNSEYVNKNIVFNWELIPPEGHYLQGQSVSSDLLNDNFLSGFKLEFFNDGQLLDFSSINQDSPGLIALSEQFSTSPGNIDNVFSNYRDFSFELNQDTLEGLDLSRSIDLRVTAVDSFGMESTGIIKTKNYKPTLFNFVDSFRSSSMNMSWGDSDTDYSGVRVRALGIPYDEEIFNEKSIFDSLQYYSSLNNSRPYQALNHSKYYIGEKVVYQDGGVYECLESFIRNSIQDDPGYSASKWKKLGDLINFEYTEEIINSYEFSLRQNWGLKYYYDLLPFDQYGSGDLMNVSDLGLSFANDSILKSYQSEIKLSEIQYRENKDSFIFNWEILDQDNQSVDIDKFRFSLSSSDIPSVLGISGSLFDSDTNVFISGITEGNNSKSLSVNSDGFTEVTFELPSTKNFNSFQYTRELNNEIYGTGGFVSNYRDYEDGKLYSSGDYVLSQDGKIFQLLFEPQVEVSPFYENWSNIKSYSVGDKFKYQNIIFNTKSSFKENDSRFKGIYDESGSYSVNDIVISPNSKIRIFSSGTTYDQGEFILYQGCIYRALFTSDQAPSPLSDFWEKASPFNDVDCDYYKLVNDFDVKIPHESPFNWKKVNPLILSEDSDYFEVYIPNYQYNVSHWSNQESYNPGDIVLYNNDIWSGLDFSYSQTPDLNSIYWTSSNFGEYSSYYGRNYLSGDLVQSNNYIYKCLVDNPRGGPVIAQSNAGQEVNSTYVESNWLPVWEEKVEYNNYIFNHVGIPESGKRNIGIEIGIIDTDGNVVDIKRKVAENPPPIITDNSFKYENITNVKIPNSLDSLTEASKVKFNFNYIDGGLREKTTKVNLYRSSKQDFSITGTNGLPYNSLTEEGSTLVKTVIGAADATFGDNINQIIDEPPIPVVDGVEEKTGYFYKILPFDDFGSGSLYQVDEKVLVWPRNYSNNNKNSLPGPVLSLTEDEIPGEVNNFGGETSFNTYFLNWDMPLSQSLNNSIINIPPNDLSHYELWFKYINEKNEQSLTDQGDADAYFRTGDGEKFSIQDNEGYRRIKGDILSSIGASEDIPVDEIDPGLKITNATNIFDIPASSPSIKVSHIGVAGEKGYFWVRAVDKAGNKGPFVGDPDALQDDLYIPGLSLELGGVSTTDLENFQGSITSEFRNTPAIVSERGNNPFIVSGGIIEWITHTIWLNGESYNISSGSATNNSNDLHYIYWNPNTIEGYEVKTSNPSDDENNSGFIVATWSNGQLQVSYHAFANALIGTAQISNAAITDAKIKSLKADQITAGNGLIADLQITEGLIKSKNFNLNGGGAGFQLNNDGTFIFRGFSNQGGESSLELDSNANLILKGKFRQVSGNDFDFIEIIASPSYFKYIDENTDLKLDPNSHDKIFIDVYFRNTSVSSINDVTLSLKYIDLNGDVQGISGSDSSFDAIRNSAEFNPLNNQSDGCIISYQITASQFNSLISQNGFMADSLIFFIKSDLSNIEKTISIPRLTEGKVGDDSIAIIGSNDNHSLVVNDDGSEVRDISGANNEIFVYEGTDLLDYVANKGNHEGLTDNGSYNLSVNYPSPSTIEASINNQGNVIFSGDSINSSIVFTVNAFIKNKSGNNVQRSMSITLSPARGGASARVARLESDSYVIKYDDNEQNPDPSTINLTINEQGFKDPQYAWEINGVPHDTSNKTLSISSNNTVWFNFSKSPNLIKVKVTEGDDSSISATDSITIVTLKDGIQGTVGRTPTYRGEWSEVKTYYAVGGAEDQAVRGDVVKYAENNNTESKYFICVKTHNTQKSKAYSKKPVFGTGYTTLNSTYWAEFGAEFESVATSLLLAEDASVTNALIVGDGEKTGTIVSNIDGDTGVFQGGFDNNGDEVAHDNGYEEPGFKIERGQDNNGDGFVVFDVGGARNGEVELTSYIRYSSKVGKFQIRGASVNNTSRENVVASLNDNDTNYLLNGGEDIDDTLATFVGGGYNNDILDPNNENSYQSLASCIIGGGSNNIVGRFSLIGAGFGNVCEDNFSAIIAGYGNQMPEGTDDNQGANFIGAGQYNRIQGGTNQTILNGQSNVISNV
jgi:hypothetical protein